MSTPPGSHPHPLAITLRPVVAGDAGFLRRLYGSTREAELAHLDWDDDQKDAFISSQFEAQRRSYEEHYRGAASDLIVVDGEPAGRLYVARGADEIRIVDIALLPAYRNRGIGSQLLGALLDEAAVADKQVTMHVERFNPALRLYERLGFVLVEDKGVHLFLEWRPPAAGPPAAS